MKLIIQIPSYNEEATLPLTVHDLPKSIPGIDELEYQVISDGSTDRTVEIAKELGIHHIVEFKNNKGLAAAFKAGADHALANGAHILVNTDADNQYFGGDIGKLVEPILKGRADIVVGTRPIMDHPEFSLPKKLLQRLGSFVLRQASQTGVRDAASGFRAYSQNALLHLNIYSNFSYCMETLIQAGLANMKIETVDIRVNPKTRDSRLFKSVSQYIFKSGKTIIGIFLLYRSKAVFFSLASLMFLVSVGLVVRYFILTHYFGSPRSQFWPSIVFAGVLLAMSAQTLFTGMLASLIAANRQLSEEVLYRLRKAELKE